MVLLRNIRGWCLLAYIVLLGAATLVRDRLFVRQPPVALDHRRLARR